MVISSKKKKNTETLQGKDTVEHFYIKWAGDAGYVEVIHACPGQHYHANTGYFIQFNYVTYIEYVESLLS
jgi:hypothetical protein